MIKVANRLTVLNIVSFDTLALVDQRTQQAW